MKKLMRLSALILIIILASCNNPDADDKTEILVAAASSMTPALSDIASKFEKTNPDIKVTFSFGSSGKLAQQIKGGAPVDVFISASGIDMDTLEKDNKIELDTRTDLTTNTLVVIGQKNGDHSLTEENLFTSEIDHFAIGNPDTVPAGVYAKEALTALGEWKALEAKLVFGKDVRQVLTFVETGNAELGIVFASDAQSSDKIEVITAIDPALHTTVVYPGAIIADTKHPNEARAFLAYMKSAQVQQILSEYGFTN